MSKDLNPTKAFIFRITHRDNVPWALDNGLQCASSGTLDPQFVAIGNPEVIDARKNRPVPCPPGGTLNDYVAFYFTPFSPMLLNIITGWRGIPKRRKEEIVIVVSSLHVLQEKNVTFLFTDRHSLLTTANFYSDLARLEQIDWPRLQRHDFKRDPDDPGKVERYQAEALVHKHLPVDALLGMVCYDDSVAARLKAQFAERGLEIEIAVKPDWYF